LKPVLQALLLADKVYEDRSTGKYVVAGTFNQISVGTIPGSRSEQGDRQSAPGDRDLGSPCAFISMTEVRGETPLVLRYVDLNDHKLLMECPFSVRGTSPIDTYEVVVPLPKLPTPRLGVYALELLCNEELLGSWRVAVRGIQGATT
jgi:hypothetical protein